MELMRNGQCFLKRKMSIWLYLGIHWQRCKLFVYVCEQNVYHTQVINNRHFNRTWGRRGRIRQNGFYRQQVLLVGSNGSVLSGKY